MNKKLHNTTVSKEKDNVPYLITFSDGIMFKVLSKASSESNITEGLVFVPGTELFLEIK